MIVQPKCAAYRSDPASIPPYIARAHHSKACHVMYKEVVMVGDENGKRGSVWRKKMESSGGGLDFGFYGERWPQPDTLDYF